MAAIVVVPPQVLRDVRDLMDRTLGSCSMCAEVRSRVLFSVTGPPASLCGPCARLIWQAADLHGLNDLEPGPKWPGHPVYDQPGIECRTSFCSWHDGISERWQWQVGQGGPFICSRCCREAARL